MIYDIIPELLECYTGLQAMIAQPQFEAFGRTPPTHHITFTDSSAKTLIKFISGITAAQLPLINIHKGEIIGSFRG